MSIVERVKQLCEKRGLTLSGLSKTLGFNKNAIYAWDEHVPAADKLQAAADYFGVSVDYLLGRTDNPTGQSRISVLREGDDAFSAATDEERAMLQAVLDAYRAQKKK